MNYRAVIALVLSYWTNRSKTRTENFGISNRSPSRIPDESPFAMLMFQHPGKSLTTPLKSVFFTKKRQGEIEQSLNKVFLSSFSFYTFLVSNELRRLENFKVTELIFQVYFALSAGDNGNN